MEFSQIAILFVVAAASAMIARFLKQPLLIGYLFAGVFLGVIGSLNDPHHFEGLGKIGVALLLFLVGLEMNVKEIPTIGKAALATGLGQIIFTSIFGYFIAFLLGFSSLNSLYIAIALTFSSTIIIVKLLSEKNELDTLHGKISMGFLLVQDFAAIIILIILAGLKNETGGPQDYLLILVKGVSLLFATYFLSVKIFPKLFSEFLDKSGELIFIVSVAWALGLAAFVGGPLGLSIEIGGFLAGLSLSVLPEHLQVASKTRPLRDFFLTIFFLFLGTNLVVSDIGSIIIPSIIFSLFVLIGNPFILLSIMGLMGYKKKTSLSISLTAAQISEFSLIVVTMGLAIGHVTSQVVSIIVLVGIVTMTLSTYMILGSDKIYKWFEKYLVFFERKITQPDLNNHQSELKKHIVLLGADRTGSVIMKHLSYKKYDFVVIDYNPTVIKKLRNQGINAIFGDFNDEDVYLAAGINECSMIISTIPTLQDSLLLLDKISLLNKKPITLLKSDSIQDGLLLYEKGADYVVQPDIVTGEHIRHIINQFGVSKKIKKIGKNHRKRIQKTIT